MCLPERCFIQSFSFFFPVRESTQKKEEKKRQHAQVIIVCNRCVVPSVGAHRRHGSVIFCVVCGWLKRAKKIRKKRFKRKRKKKKVREIKREAGTTRSEIKMAAKDAKKKKKKQSVGHMMDERVVWLMLRIYLWSPLSVSLSVFGCLVVFFLFFYDYRFDLKVLATKWDGRYSPCIFVELDSKRGRLYLPVKVYLDRYAKTWNDGLLRIVLFGLYFLNNFLLFFLFFCCCQMLNVTQTVLFGETASVGPTF